MAKPKDVDWVAIEGAYRAGSDPLRSIADTYGVTEGAIRARAKKYGWTRNPEQTKRTIVKARMAGVTQDVTQNVMRNIENAAAEDVEDMERGLRINRLCLLSLETSAASAEEPREVKIIVEATKAAIESIRTIRGLNEPEGKGDDSTSDDAIMARLFPELANSGTTAPPGTTEPSTEGTA